MVSLESIAKKVASYIKMPVSYQSLDWSSFNQQGDEKTAVSQDFFTLASRLEATQDSFFLFESLLDEGCYGRYSVLGVRPVMRFKAEGHSLFVLECHNNQDESWEKINLPAALNPYTALKELVPQDKLSFQYAGGLVGYLSYDAMRFMDMALDHLNTSDLFPSFEVGLYQDGLIYNQLTGDIDYFYYSHNRYEDILRAMDDALQTDPVQQQAPLCVSFLGDELDAQQHTQQVLDVQQKIKEGYVFQCEVGFKSRYKISGDVFEIYKKLRQLNPSPNMFFMRYDERVLIGASPELLFRLQEGLMETFPLAGTAARGNSHQEDQELASLLRKDDKEIAEHNMLVDLHRNDIGRVARFDTVRVRRLMDIKRFSHVQHLSSEIIGFIADKEDMFSALAANFPAGTLTGAPKIEAMKLINQNEASGRGPYGGAIGHFGFNGDCTFAIPIRSLFISGQQAYIQTSGGIVADSQPDSEYLEIQRKLSAMKHVLESFLS